MIAALLALLVLAGCSSAKVTMHQQPVDDPFFTTTVQGLYAADQAVTAVLVVLTEGVANGTVSIDTAIRADAAAGQFAAALQSTQKALALYLMKQQTQPQVEALLAGVRALLLHVLSFLETPV